MTEGILTRIAAGDPAAVDDCLRNYGGLVWSLARRFSANHADAEDAVQEIFVDVWRSAPRFDPQRSAENTYITMIARRRLIDRRRRTDRTIRTAAMPDESLAASGETNDRQELFDEVDRARKAMNHLRPEERQVLDLAINHGLSQSEIAATTQLPLGTVKTHSRRGLMRLRAMLGVDAADAIGGTS